MPRFLTVSRMHIVAIAAMGAHTFGWMLTGRYPWLAAGVVALDWYLVNLLNRVVDVPEDRINAIPGAQWADRHARSITTAGLGTLAFSLAAVHVVEPSLTPLRLGYHLLGVAYNWRILPGGRRLKELYVLKNVASALGFIITVFGYPLATAGWSLADAPPDIVPATVAIAAAWFFLFELSYEVIYDLRDIAGDKAAGVRTFPVVHGPRGASRIIDALIAASLLILTAGWIGGLAPWRLFVMGLAPLLQLILYKRWLRRPTGMSSADCVAITWMGAGLLACWHLWNLAGLPGAAPAA